MFVLMHMENIIIIAIVTTVQGKIALLK